MGLTGQITAPRLLSKNLGPPKGRGVVAEERIHKGQYVCEYRTYAVYPVGSDLHRELEEEYRRNCEGSYIVETAYPVHGCGRLCFDATRRYRDVGRLINHDPSQFNLKISAPQFLRGKWRVALVAVRDIEAGKELTYDYGSREISWMRARMKRTETATSTDRGANSEELPAEERGENSVEPLAERGEVSEEPITVSSLDGATSTPTLVSKDKKPVHRNHYWCPIQDCASGPVQKIGQHLQKVHKLEKPEIAKLSKLKRRAPVEAVKFKMPNPAKQSSGLRPIALFSTQTTSSKVESCQPTGTKAAAASSAEYHSGGAFLQSLLAHLQTPAGGGKNTRTTRQITKAVGKYLFFLNPTMIEEQELMLIEPVQRYLDSLFPTMGVSGISHRLLSHKAAVRFMKLSVSN